MSLLKKNDLCGTVSGLRSDLIRWETL
jgi:hypothetical protein